MIVYSNCCRHVLPCLHARASIARVVTIQRALIGLVRMVATVLYCSESSGRVLTYFDRVGTVGMERDSSWSFVPFQAVCVHFEFQATEQPTRTKNNPTDFCGGIAQLDPKTGVPSRGQRVLLARTMTFHANTRYSARQASEQAVLAIQVAPSVKI